MKIVILPSARDDLEDGFHFYENQESGLGSYFLESLFSDVDSLRLYAGIHRKVFESHRSLSKRFPYAIYYDMEAQTIFVKAILDCRRDPKFHREKLRGG
jgi:plasmid stabilization system protein ParE